MARRIAVGFVAAVAGGLVGAWLRPRVYEWFGSELISLDEMTPIFQGAFVGAVGGGLIGFVALGRRRQSAVETLMASLGCLLAAVLFLTGVWYIGDFTNADGFEGVEPYFGIMLIPLSILLVWFIARSPRRAGEE